MVFEKVKIKTAASDLFKEQTKYDILYHKKRIEWLESLSKLDSFHTNLLMQSKRIIKNPCEGYKSVDIEDDEYIGELDEFENELNKP